ncbi:MAG: NAD-dependent malic enzyme [Nitrospinae bacterium]|nr:NAD-dependent malic enzyme [Nitrospinota bacterium]
MTIERYYKWLDEKGNYFIPVTIEGESLINNRTLNKGTAFSLRERKELGLEGLVPDHVSSMDEQLVRVREGLNRRKSPLGKYNFLRSLQDRNETLFYALVNANVEEIIPIIYTPTVGLACQQFSHLYKKARGLYITPKNVDSMHEMVQHFPSKNIEIIVATDNQGILGLGDLGIGGMGIPIGKLSLYTLGAGIHPACCLPITLDVGTNNEELLNDPLYLGLPQKRLKGEEYANFIEKFVENIKRFFPGSVLQWEDFSKQNAFTNLDTYRNALPSFNDDIQGTGAVTLAGIINAMKIKKEKLADQVYAIHGAGAGGIGVARQIHAALVKEGLDSKSAFERIFVLDSKGVVLSDCTDHVVDDYKKHFAKPKSIAANWKLNNPCGISLLELLENVKVSVLIGTSGQTGAFNEHIIRQMVRNTDRPVIFPLSNPTANCEALPEDIYRISDGKAIVATGSPFGNVNHAGKNYRVGQGNNVFIFPGVGLAAIIGKTKFISNDIFTTSAYALADCTTGADLAENAVFPRIKDLQDVSVKVAEACLKEIIRTEPGCSIKPDDVHEVIKKSMWKPEYLPYKRV